MTKQSDNAADPRKDLSQKNPEDKGPGLEYYRDLLREFPAMAEKASQIRYVFFQHILLVSSSVLGILISLHQNNSPCIYTRLVFLLSLLLFAAGILCIGIILHDHSLLPGKLQQKYSDEAVQAFQERREMPPVVLPEKKKRTLLLEKIGPAILLSALLVLIAHEVLISFV
ncbi:MAG: hypothetical protein LBB62_05600 [Proteiniphilum sp.]|jgi:hypothetical protein|nr:hypothetical protein [Proteiniphilum sp.]